jgi:hypothetical protein
VLAIIKPKSCNNGKRLQELVNEKFQRVAGTSNPSAMYIVNSCCCLYSCSKIAAANRRIAAKLAENI